MAYGVEDLPVRAAMASVRSRGSRYYSQHRSRTIKGRCTIW